MTVNPAIDLNEGDEITEKIVSNSRLPKAKNNGSKTTAAIPTADIVRNLPFVYYRFPLGDEFGKIHLCR